MSSRSHKVSQCPTVHCYPKYKYLVLDVISPPDGEPLEDGSDVVGGVEVVLHREAVAGDELGDHDHLRLLPPDPRDLVLDEHDLDLVLVDDILDDCGIVMNTGSIAPSSR